MTSFIIVSLLSLNGFTSSIMLLFKRKPSILVVKNPEFEQTSNTEYNYEGIHWDFFVPGKISIFNFVANFTTLCISSFV